MQIKYHRVVAASIVLAPRPMSQNLLDSAGVKHKVINPWRDVETLRESIF